MNVLVLCPHFAPDLAPTGTVMTAIAEELAAAGHRLHVVTALPWYQHHRIEPGWGGRLWRHEDTPTTCGRRAQGHESAYRDEAQDKSQHRER